VPNPIEAKVAAVLGKMDLVLNKGAADGVQVGMRFAVLDRIGIEIIDPDSHEVIGSLDVEKTVVKVVRVKDRLAVARTFRTVGDAMMMTSLFQRPVLETLEAEPGSYVETRGQPKAPIAKGDRAIQVTGDEV